MTKVIDQKIGQSKNDFYVYTWARPDTGDVFYVGKGRMSRDVRSKDRHNPIFKNIVSKLNGMGMSPTVERIMEGLTEAEAFELEMKVIARHGRIDLKTGTLANLTSGGEGKAGAILSEEDKKKKSLAMRDFLSDPANRSLLSARVKKRYEDPLEREKASAALVKRYEDPTEREKTSAALRGKPKTSEHVESVRTALVEAWKSDDLRESHRRIALMRGPTKTNRSVYKGVSFDKSNNKWMAQAEVSGRNKHLGRYDSAEDAAKAYDRFVVVFYGHDVYTNFPIEGAANDNLADNDNHASILTNL